MCHPTSEQSYEQHKVSLEDLEEAFDEVLTDFPTILDYLEKDDPRAEQGVFPLTYRLLNALALRSPELGDYLRANGSMGAGAFLIAFYTDKDGRQGQLQHLHDIATCHAASPDLQLAMRVVDTFNRILPQSDKPNEEEEARGKAVLLKQGPIILAELKTIRASFAPATLAQTARAGESGIR